jgi:hypothetical protein
MDQENVVPEETITSTAETVEEALEGSDTTPEEVKEVPAETITESEAAEAEAGAITREEAVAAGIDVDTVEAEATEAEVVPDAEEVPVLMFAGQVVVADGVRTVGEKEVHHLTLSDGSEIDASDEEYTAAVEASK